MPKFTVEMEDNNKDLVKALEKRTAMLERILANISKKKETGAKDLIKMINTSRKQDMKNINRLASSFSGALKKASPKVIIKNESKTVDVSPIVTALNKRISMLETLLKKAPRGSTDKVVINMNKTLSRQVRFQEKSTRSLLEAFNRGISPFPRDYSSGVRVIPSPS